MTEPLTLTAVAVMATVLGSLEGQADAVRGRTVPFGPAAKNLTDGILGATILLAFAVSFFWLWRSWPWYLDIGLLAAVTVVSHLVVTRRTIEIWIGLRPLVAVSAVLAAATVWLLHPPP